MCELLDEQKKKAQTVVVSGGLQGEPALLEAGDEVQ